MRSQTRRRLRAALHSHGLVLNLFIEERCKGPVFSVLSKYLLDILITDKILVFGKEAVNPTNVSYILRGNIPGLILVTVPSCRERKILNSNTARDLFSIDKEGNQAWVILQ
ncbi:uncharacterized protein LOC127860451 [Dreissena polymorpha]|uniref:uncharacterized protein LOC127860451 n=1 Tax=Dreissena polymorpha TaxID=45954 RepID=UPI002264D0F6|nr:uncharacterized protein LOC127860451 [Dreissena polymorpha]